MKSIYQIEFEKNIGYADELLDCLLDDYDFIAFVHQLHFDGLLVPAPSEGRTSGPPEYFSNDALVAITDLALALNTRKLYLRTLRALRGIIAWRLLHVFTETPEELIVELQKLVDFGGLAFSELLKLTEEDIKSEIKAEIEVKDIVKSLHRFAWFNKFDCIHIGGVEP
jgi:hypothetical protein